MPTARAGTELVAVAVTVVEGRRVDKKDADAEGAATATAEAGVTVSAALARVVAMPMEGATDATAPVAEEVGEECGALRAATIGAKARVEGVAASGATCIAVAAEEGARK